MASVVEATLLASAAYTTTQILDPLYVAGSSQLASGFMGVPMILEAVMDTTAAATGSVTLSIQEFDIAAGTWANVLASAAVTATGRVRLVIGPEVPAAANSSATLSVPKRWRVVATANNANSQTYSVSARLTGAY